MKYKACHLLRVDRGSAEYDVSKRRRRNDDVKELDNMLDEGVKDEVKKITTKIFNKAYNLTNPDFNKVGVFCFGDVAQR